MSKRTIEIKVRLNRKEADTLDKKVRKSRLSREAYLRHLIGGVISRDAPPPDYYAMMRELYQLGNTLEQLERKAPALEVLDVQACNSAIQEVRGAVKEITNAVILPQPIGK